jgi:hypothetical protein
MSEAELQAAPREFDLTIIRNGLIGVGVFAIVLIMGKTVIDNDPAAVAYLEATKTPNPEAAADTALRSARDMTPNYEAATSTPQSGYVVGGIPVEVFGQQLICGRMNNPKYPETFDPSLPVALSAMSIMRMIGEPGIDDGPYVVLKGEQVEVRHELTGQAWRLDANGTLVCID